MITPLISLIERPDHKVMDEPSYEENELASAFDWLREDPTHRAIEAPTELSAVLDMYRARRLYPEETFSRAQFLAPGQPFPDGTETRYVGYRGYFL